MALIRKAQGGSGFGDYWWVNDGDVVEVHDDDFAVEVSRNRWPGFSIADDHQLSSTELTEKRRAEESAEGSTEDPEGDSMGGSDGAGTDDPGDGSDVPAGSVASIVAWVGDDVDRARAALAAETDRRVEPRPTLVQQLTAIING